METNNLFSIVFKVYYNSGSLNLSCTRWRLHQLWDYLYKSAQWDNLFRTSHEIQASAKPVQSDLWNSEDHINGIANSHNYIHINVPLIIKTVYIVLNVLRTGKMTTDYGVYLL